MPVQFPETYHIPTGRRIFLQELVNSAAVRIEAKRLGGEAGDPYAKGIMRTAAILLSLHHGISVDEVEWEAEQRAQQVFSMGQDWRRELRLFDSHVKFNHDGEVFDR